MEKIRISEYIYNIKSIKEYPHLIEIEFEDKVDLSSQDLSSFELLTCGDIICREFKGYTTIYKTEGNTIILSNNESIYVEPTIKEPIIEPIESYIPTESELARQEIAILKTQIEATDYQIIKCSEYQLLGLDLPYDLGLLHEERQNFRDKINELELKLI